MSLLQDALRKTQKGEGGKRSPNGGPLSGGNPARSGSRRRLRVGAAFAAACLLGAGTVTLLSRSGREGSMPPLSPMRSAPASSMQPQPQVSAPPSPSPAVTDVAALPPAPRVPARRSPSAPLIRARVAENSRGAAAHSTAAAPVRAESAKGPQLARYNEGIAAQAGGDWEAAARLFQEVVSKDPSIVEGWNSLGNALLRLGKAADADRAFLTALSLDPDYPAALMNAGLLRLGDGRNGEAERYFTRAAALDPRNPAPRVNLAVARARRGALAEAEEALEAARRDFPSNPDVLYHLGTVRERSGNRERAGEAYASFLAASNGRRPGMERLVRERLREWSQKP